ncbi:MAG TPA: hypothetical protein VFH38_07165 [Jatrophihabitans sp.]|nr:hypothetical protein [Jatrophihabitans sp.]
MLNVRGLDVNPARPRPPKPRRWLWAVVAAAVVAAIGGLVFGFGAALFHGGGRGLPSFPSLAEHPDPSLHGTVAYFSNDTGCVRIVAASGQPSRNVLCIPARDLAPKPAQLLKPAGPQLVWLSGDRLEVTMFFWSPAARRSGPPDFHPGWQKIVDVRTGTVSDVPRAQVPTRPLPASGPEVAPSGDRLAYTFDPSTGRATVTLTDRSGTRTLLSVQGPGEYTYSFGPVFWAPNWQWIAGSDDGRILVITAGSPARTRVLVTGSGGGAGGGTAGPVFAITGADLLAPVS